ncbi:hypothetical protein [Wolbachia endosymbiont (group A) of Volucella bombylans]|uniref:hypothetical protein n=1 Tax=Wolbachia endosymbiont (group A) of Volucella bombylans TaxID=3066158 RepID=UPI0031330FF3
MDIKVKYAGITKRAAAYIVDQIIFLVCYSLFYLLILFILSGEPLADVFNYVFPDIDTNSDLISERYEILEDLYQFPLQGKQMDNDGRKAILK